MLKIFQWLKVGLYGLAILWAVLIFALGEFKESSGATTVGALAPLVIVYGVLWVISTLSSGAKRLSSGLSVPRKAPRSGKGRSSRQNVDLGTALEIYAAAPSDKVHDLVSRIAAAYQVDRAKAYQILSRVRKESKIANQTADDSAAKTEDPAVDDLVQISTNADGETVVTRVRPITAALMTFVKRSLELPDTIDISPDEMHGIWIEEFSVHAADSSSEEGDHTLVVKIETFEEQNFLTLTVLVDEVNLLGRDKAALEKLVAEASRSLPKGSYQILDGTGESAEQEDGDTKPARSKNSNTCRVLFAATLTPEEGASAKAGRRPLPVIEPQMIAKLFEAGMLAANTMRVQLSSAGWGQEQSRQDNPGLLIERTEFRAAVAAAKGIATARQDQILSPGLLLAGVVRASQEAGSERATVREALGVDGLREAFDFLKKLSIDPSTASEPAKDRKMPLSADLKRLLKDHKGSEFAEFVAQLLVVN